MIRATRVAAIADVHGNLTALRAVLAEIAGEGVDLIVDCGDTALGPQPAETLDLFAALGERVLHVHGNCDREQVAAYDAGVPPGPDDDAFLAVQRFSGGQITRGQRNALAAFAPVVVVDVEGLGPTCFCHGSPRSEDEIVTEGTPDAVLEEMLADVPQRVVVGGHTHMQLDRAIGRHRVINAGSVGMAYEGRPGAYWALLGPDVELRRTAYDLDEAEAGIRASGYPDADDLVETLRTPPGRDEAIAVFEARPR